MSVSRSERKCCEWNNMKLRMAIGAMGTMLNGNPMHNIVSLCTVVFTVSLCITVSLIHPDVLSQPQ